MNLKKVISIITLIAVTAALVGCNKNSGVANNRSPENTTLKAESKGSFEVIDVFSELSVTFEGENGSGEAIVEYTGKNDFVKSEVTFKTDRNGKYKNKDTAVVKLDFSEYKAEENNILFKETEHEYTVDGLWGTILYTDGYDFSECNKALEERMFDKDRSDSRSNIRELDVGNNFATVYVDGERDYSSWVILSAEYEPIQGKLIITNPNKCMNEYTLFYKATLSCEKIESANVTEEARNSRYAVGDRRDWVFIIGEATRNVFVEKDSNIVIADSKSIKAFDGIMSQTTIYKPDKIEYTDNFDEYYEKMIYLNRDTEIYDVEI